MVFVSFRVRSWVLVTCVFCAFLLSMIFCFTPKVCAQSTHGGVIIEIDIVMTPNVEGDSKDMVMLHVSGIEPEQIEETCLYGASGQLVCCFSGFKEYVLMGHLPNQAYVVEVRASELVAQKVFFKTSTP